MRKLEWCRSQEPQRRSAIALYDRIGVGYSSYRRPDPRVARQIHAAIRQARSVLNVGAGAGSYEPRGDGVIAVEPSAQMIRQRAAGSAPCIQAVAGALPLRDRSFDAVLALLTIHHWPKQRKGLREMRRVARDRVVILTWDPEHEGFWLVQDYLPEILQVDRRIFPSVREIEAAIGPAEVTALPVPADCIDGFLGAYWRRPAEYLKPQVRAAISAFSMIDCAAGLERLERDLAGGRWQQRYGALDTLAELDIGYPLLTIRCN